MRLMQCCTRPVDLLVEEIRTAGYVPLGTNIFIELEKKGHLDLHVY